MCILYNITVKFGRDIDESYACSSQNREGVKGVLMVKKKVHVSDCSNNGTHKTYMLMQERLKLYRCFHIYLSCMRSVVKWPRERERECVILLVQ